MCFQFMPRSGDASHAARLDGFGFDLLSRFQDGFGPARTEVCGREVVAEKLGVDGPPDFTDRVELRLFESYRTGLRLIDGAGAMIRLDSRPVRGDSARGRATASGCDRSRRGSLVRARGVELRRVEDELSRHRPRHVRAARASGR